MAGREVSLYENFITISSLMICFLMISGSHWYSRENISKWLPPALLSEASGRHQCVLWSDGTRFWWFSLAGPFT
jgi:hypothetical protein